MDPDERDSLATQFGVSSEQVERDHLISHLLAFLSQDFGERIHFIGGTAVARTHLPHGRLSEDTRDLWDLWALSGVGAIDVDAAALFRQYGPTNKTPAPHMFNRAPSDAEWQAQLAGQTRLRVTASEALKSVRDAWRHASRPPATTT